MGNYINSTLLPNEEIVVRGRIHWALFVAPVLVLVVGLLATSVFLIMLGVVFLVWRTLVWNYTEMAVTNKRVIAKFGIIRRNAIDVGLPKVEGLTYHQGIIGRLLGYGSIVVRGTGVGGVPVPYIADPAVFSREVGALIHA